MKFIACFLVTLGCLASCDQVISQDEEVTRWYRGNLHTHSLWSDGNDFPEMITKWYVDNDYHFLALTDHNILSRGERWMSIEKIEQRAGSVAMEKYLESFGKDWVETRVLQKQNAQGKSGRNKQVRLKGLKEFRGKFESPGKFLLIESEEISDSAEGKPIHMNAANLRSLIQPVGGKKTVVEAINNNLRAANAQQGDQPILVNLNHPNFGWAVTAEELAQVTNERFVEVYNGHPSINFLGDDTRPGIEKMWDIANTIRIGELKAEALFGLATDDSHHYHDRAGQDARTGRGWVVVKVKSKADTNSLTPAALINAMNNGEFYCSSGVELDSLEYDATQKTLELKIKPRDGVTFSTQFIGTLRNYDKKSTAQLTAEGKPVRATRIYSKDVGKVLATSDSMEPKYQLTGDELYVRAVVTSSRKHPRASFKEQQEQAWTQPVGW